MATLGRPTKYTEELLEKARAYIDGAHKDAEDIVPSVAGLACYLGTSRDTLHSWAKEEDKKLFSDMLREMQSKQERMLLSGGLGGVYNAAITKLMLAKHDYSDKQEVTGKDGAPLNPVLADEDRAILNRWKEGQK